MIEECDREIRRQVEKFKAPEAGSTASPAEGPTSKPAKQVSLREELKRAFGVDLTKIPGIQLGIAQTLFGEIGPDFSKFRSASAFASWLGLCPDNEISGGKVLWVGTRKVNCRAATAFRLAARCLHHSKSPLGDFYRRMRTKLGAPKAITAAAHKLARIIYHRSQPNRSSMKANLPRTICMCVSGSKRSFAQPPKHSDSSSCRPRRSEFLRRAIRGAAPGAQGGARCCARSGISKG